MSDWTSKAACRDADPRLFFPADGESKPQRKRRERKAKKVCAPCQAAGDCLAYALAYNEREGIWGGLSPEQRARRFSAPAPDPEPEPKRPVVVEKLCACCGVIQPVFAFGSDKRQKDGLNAWCKECTNEAARRRRREAKEAVAS